MRPLVVTLFVVSAAAGALARAAVGGWLNREGFAWGTLVVNASGSLALGLLAGMGPPAITVIGVGGIGAYTTFSSFARDVVAEIERGHLPAALAYVVATVVMCVAAAAAGLALVA